MIDNRARHSAVVGRAVCRRCSGRGVWVMGRNASLVRSGVSSVFFFALLQSYDIYIQVGCFFLGEVSVFAAAMAL